MTKDGEVGPISCVEMSGKSKSDDDDDDDDDVDDYDDEDNNNNKPSLLINRAPKSGIVKKERVC
jgi:hypothetical protein